MSIAAMSACANQPLLVGTSDSHEGSAHVQKADAGRAQQILEHAADRKIDIQGLHVDVERADRLIAVEQHLAPLARASRTMPGMSSLAPLRKHTWVMATSCVCSSIAWANMLERNVAVGGARHVHDLRAARLLRVPDLRVGRKLEVADDDLVARPGKVERARQRIETGGHGGGDGDLIGRACSSVRRQARAPIRSW